MKAPEDNPLATPPDDQDIDENAAYSIKPENTLYRKIGYDVKIEDILTPEKIQECQVIIEKAHVDLFDDALQNLSTLETEYALVNKNLSQSKPHLQKIAKVAFVLKGRLEAIGLTLGFEVAKSLWEFAKISSNVTNDHIVVLRKHIDVLTVVLRTKVQGDGGTMGKEMMESLALLIKKI